MNRVMSLLRGPAVFATAIAAVFLLEAVAPWARAQQAEAQAALTARIDRLIRQLDDEKFEVREKAETELAAIGEPALSKLTTAAKDPSAERSQRAAKILKELRRASVGLRH